MIVQIYEIQTPAEARSMIDLGVDHIGGVLLSESEWRVPAIKESISAVQAANRKSSLIPLFNDPETIFQALDHYEPHILHLCNALPAGGDLEAVCDPFVNFQQAVRSRFPEVAIMRSIPIARPGQAHQVPSLKLARIFAPVSDYFLTDTLILPEPAQAEAHQPVAGFVGITGKICDWDVARQLVDESPIPVILAGGIDPENVAEGIRRVRPAGVDSCTCTNARDADGRPVRFQKDLELVRNMIAAAKVAFQEIQSKPSKTNTTPGEATNNV